MDPCLATPRQEATMISSVNLFVFRISVNSFVGRLRIFQRGTQDRATKQNRAIYRFSTLVTGGLYQVRIGIRDLKSSRSGNAMDSIKVPKLEASLLRLLIRS